MRAPDPLDSYRQRLDGPVHRSGEYLDKRIGVRRFSLDNPPDKFIWSTDDTKVVDGVDFYNQPVIKYPYADRAYLMPFSAFYHQPDWLEIQLAVSRDGIHWQRPGDRQAHPVEFHTIEGFGHGWARRHGLNELIWEFLSPHRRSLAISEDGK